MNYQLRVYKGKTKKYEELKQRLEFYQVITLLLFINLKKQNDFKKLAVFHFMCDGYIQRNKKVVQYKCLR